MTKPKSKYVAMRVEVRVEVRVPKWMTASQVRREVRTLINNQSNYLDCGPEFQEFRVSTVSVEPIR